MAAAVAMPGLRPSTSGVQFTARPALRPSSDTSQNGKVASSHHYSGQRLSHGRKSDADSVPDVSLSVIEIEAKLRNKVREKYEDIQQGFQKYDANQSLSITKGEFRRVLEMYCFPLTTDQFDAVMNKIDLNPNGTVRYCDFLDKFYGKNKPQERWRSGVQRNLQSQSSQDMNTDMIENMLKEKIQSNLKNVLKAFRLYDYNRDGQIQRHELRKVLENYCFRMTDAQFDKLYKRYDFQHKGVLNYKDFLKNLGLHVVNHNKPVPDDLLGAVQWWEDAENNQQKYGPVLRQFEDSKLRSLTLDEIELEFRKKIKDNLANLKRMFLVFDKHLDGFVSLEELKSALDQFVMPLSNSVFAQLMTRFHIKASGKVSWEHFLQKFQSPHEAGNGQTLPIKPAHKFFPIRGVDEKRDIKEVIRLLHQHVVNSYSSFRDAFLQIDKSRKGWISRKELRKILNTFKFRTSNEQLRELMMLLDPLNTNCISYHKFLDLFEEKENEESHKWLVSCHKPVDNNKPAILSWESVEELLQQKISSHWKDVSKFIVKHDVSSTGKISVKDLRRIVEKIGVPLNDDHFNHLLSRVEDKSEDGKVNYTEFFNSLGVTVRPGDLEGLSTQITNGSDEAELRRNTDLYNRQQQADMNIINRASLMSCDEILTRLKDRLSQHSAHLYTSFHQYGFKGKVSKKNFRLMLENLGFYVDEEQFKEICSRLSFHKSHMTYSDFVANFEDPRIGGPSGELAKVNNHHVNPVRGDEVGMTAEMAEQKLLSKLRENFENLRGAFYKFDDDHNGLLTKKNFRRMLDAFMCKLNDAEFERFCQKLGINKHSKVSYQDFLDAFEVRDTADGHKWLNSNHRFNEVRKMKLMTAEEVHEQLALKAYRHYNDLAKAFRMMDKSGNGVITKAELRNTLYNFMMPMNKDEFEKLWQRYAVDGQSVITHQDFLRQLSGQLFAPGDIQGTSGKITLNNELTVQEHLNEQQLKQLNITVNQANRAEAYTVSQILQELKDKIRDKYKDFHSAFKTYDKRHRGYLTAANIQQALIDFNFILDDDQLYDLLERIELSKPRSRLTYEDFLRMFEEGHVSNYEPPPKDVTYPQVKYDKLDKETAENKMREKIMNNADTIHCALQAADPKNTGKIHIDHLRSILDNFCFKLTDEQFKQMISSIHLIDGNMVDYHSFMESFREMNGEEDSIPDVQQHLANVSQAQISSEEVDSQIREVLTTNYHPISHALSDADYAKLGVVSKDDFRQILEKFSITLTNDQYENLLSKLKINEFQNINYHHFLKKYSAAEHIFRPATSCGTPMLTRRPDTSEQPFGRTLHSSMSVGLCTPRPFTPLVNAQDTEQKIRDEILRHWKDIQRNCRQADPENTGNISQSDFKFVMGSYAPNLTDDDIRKLMLKYDIKNNGMFCYNDFLRHFVLHLRPQEEAQALLTRRKIQPHKLASHPQSPHEMSAGKRLHQSVATRWKDMRRNFREFDPKSHGTVSYDDFHQVLRNYNVNLSEDEFSHLLFRYGNENDNMLNYNVFIKEYLKKQ